MPPIRVLIADDHAIVREGLRTLIASEPETVDRARKILEAHATWSRALQKQIWTQGVEKVQMDEEMKKRLRSLGYFK